MTYGAEQENQSGGALRKKYDLCKHFSEVLSKVDPGFSEIKNFVLRELHFCKLLICQQDLERGVVGKNDYLWTTRMSLSALEDIERNKKLISFDQL